MFTKLLISSYKARLILVSLLFLWGCSQSEQYLKIQGSIFGTNYHITYRDPSTGVNKAIIEGEVTQRLNTLDYIFSTYKKDSELSQFNQLPETAFQPKSPVIKGDHLADHRSNNTNISSSIMVSSEFIEVLSLSQKIYQQSNQAFNPAIGPLVNLWGFGPKLSTDNFKSQPSSDLIQQALTAIDFSSVKNHERQLYKTSNVYIDFSAVAKGYAVDQLAALLKSHNIEHFMIEIGGELVTSGVNPKGNAWRIGVEKPTGLVGEISDVLNLHNAAVATSGDYRNYFDIDGQRYSHTIDPRTGYPVNHALASVTVIAESSASADAWATAFMVLGEKDGVQLAEQYNISSLFIYRDRDKYTAKQVAGFSQYLE